MYGKRRLEMLALAVAVLLIVSLLYVYQINRQEESFQSGISKVKEPVRIGIPLQPTSALALIALDQGMFKRRGIDPVISEYPSGKRVLVDGFFSGNLDVGISAEVPATFGALNNHSFKIVAALFNADNVNRIVARKDRGIHTPKDLRGKRIGTQKSSAVHYFLHLFLIEHGISEKNVELSFMKAEQLIESINKGEIDAFSMREPYVSQAIDLLGDNAIVFDEPGLYQQFDLMLTTPELVTKKPNVIKSLLTALLDAEQLATTDPDLAINIVAKQLDVDRGQIAKIWPTLKVSVSMEQAHLIVLESEARWAIQVGLTEAHSIPDFLNYIAPDNLSQLRPGNVTIIH